MDKHFTLRVGMIEANDGQSTPDGSVIVDITETTVTTAFYKIHGTGVGEGRTTVLSLWQRQIGVDSMPHITGWADMTTVGAIRDWFEENNVREPDAFYAYCTAGSFGLTYQERFRKGVKLSR